MFVLGGVGVGFRAGFEDVFATPGCGCQLPFFIDLEGQLLLYPRNGDASAVLAAVLEDLASAKW